jgi:hypothetical protein
MDRENQTKLVQDATDRSVSIITHHNIHGMKLSHQVRK